jgi:iron-sulfur cluster repair protein YtfE (RIC family)
MVSESLAGALEREHREIDEGIEAFMATRERNEHDAAPLVRAMDALRRHIYLEEELLFPPLRSAGLMAPVFVMLREHGEMWTTLDAIEALLGQDPKSASVAELCDELVARLDAHNAKEEAILYPQADPTLSGSAGVELKAFLDSGRMPDGWVCERART